MKIRQKTLPIFLIFALCGVGFGQKTKITKFPILNGLATFLPKPGYPQKAEDFCVGGKVKVKVLVDENGNVIEAKAISGDELLRKSAVEAAKKAKFRFHHYFPVKVKGIVVYNFDSLAPKCIVINRIVNNRAVYLPKPIFKDVVHPKHLQLKTDETIKIEIIVNEEGKVTNARAISGHPLLRSRCENAARNATFSPINQLGRIRAKALLIYKIKLNGEVVTKF
jgi:TonB family protein